MCAGLVYLHAACKCVMGGAAPAAGCVSGHTDWTKQVQEKALQRPGMVSGSC